MADPKDRQLVAFASVFAVDNVATSRDFYHEALGFSDFFVMGDPPTYAIIEREAVSLHLMPASQNAGVAGQSSIYVFVCDVDALHDELVARSCPIQERPADSDYGMREMSVRDPDGNRLTFGQEVKSAP